MKYTIVRSKRIIMSLTLLMLAATIPLSGSSNLVSASAEDVVATYKAKCASCHALDGSGSTATGKKLKVRDIASADVQKQTDAQLQTMISKGKGKMPGYEKSLGAEQVKLLTAYMRQLGKKKA